MTDPPRTPASTLIRAHDIGADTGLRYVYAGNLPGGVQHREHTFCANCREVLIRRHGFYVESNRMNRGCCPKCGTAIPGVWEDHPPGRSTGSGFPRAVQY